MKDSQRASFAQRPSHLKVLVEDIGGMSAVCIVLEPERTRP